MDSYVDYVYYKSEQKELFDREVKLHIDEKGREIAYGMWFEKPLYINALESLVKNALKNRYVSESR